MTKDTLKEAILQKLRVNCGCTAQQAGDGDMLRACAMVLRDIMAERSALTRRGFSCLVPTAKLVGDTTYRRTTAGFIYLAVAHDLCTHMVVG